MKNKTGVVREKATDIKTFLKNLFGTESTDVLNDDYIEEKNEAIDKDIKKMLDQANSNIAKMEYLMVHANDEKKVKKSAVAKKQIKTVNTTERTEQNIKVEKDIERER